LDAAVANGSVGKQTTPAAIVAAVAKQPRDFAPGSDYEYSNTNYVLLGLVVERASGLPLHSYYARNIFEPAGMKDTFAGHAPANAAIAIGYQLARAVTPLDPGDSSWYYGCGDVLSTSDDLARFDIALMAGKLVDAASMNEMISVAIPTGNGRGSYGLGVEKFPIGTKVLVGHHGGLPGFESDNEMIPTEHFAVVTLGNDFAYSTAPVLDAALSSYFPADLAQSIRERGAKIVQTPEEISLSEEFSAFLRALVAGKFPSEKLDDAVTKQLTPETLAAIAKSFAAKGAFQRLDLTGVDRVGQYRRYHYIATFENAKVPLAFVVDANGKIAGFLEAK
jgi:hypothetical protein